MSGPTDRPLRILAFPGLLQNANILRAKLEPVRRALGGCEFTVVDPLLIVHMPTISSSDDEPPISPGHEHRSWWIPDHKRENCDNFPSLDALVIYFRSILETQETSMGLADAFEDPRVHFHAGGHFIPTQPSIWRIRPSIPSPPRPTPSRVARRVCIASQRVDDASSSPSSLLLGTTTAMAAPSAAPLRSLAFPPEILLHILSYSSNSYASDEYIDLNERNADLASLALVSRAFQAATYSVLYGDLRLAWMADKVKALRSSFNENPQLLPLVRRLEATAVPEDTFVFQQMHLRDDSDWALAKQSWLEGYCRRNGLEEDSQEWLQVMEDGFEDHSVEDSPLRDAWAADTTRDAKHAWDTNGHGTWAGERNPEGSREFLDLIASAPALRSVAVRGFVMKLDATDIATRGPYPLIESLEAPQSSPFFADHRLSSFLASSTPNLRSLSGNCAFDSRKAPLITLPSSLIRLEIAGYNPKSRINALLLQIQPTLRSLTLIPSCNGWASSPTLGTLLSSLESFNVTDNLHGNDDSVIAALALAFAASSSLRHLELVPASATIIAALPPSLQSILVFPATDNHMHVHYGSETGDDDDELEREERDLGVEMGKVLELMKTAATQPLRIEFVTAAWRGDEERVAWEEWREAYATEGHILSHRSWYQRR
ncbi:hypothetical protein RQP46_004208 [Phenoliferia psychrophenolica]